MFKQVITHLEEHSNNLLRQTTSIGDVPSDEIQAQLRQFGHAITVLKIGQLGGLSALVSLIRQWGTDRNIIGPDAKATSDSQFQKLLEEVDEIREGLEKKDQHAIVDGIGDSTVVLILLAELVGVKFETCLLAAYDEIKARKGKMVDGKFVKNPATMEKQPDQSMTGYFVPTNPKP